MFFPEWFVSKIVVQDPESYFYVGFGLPDKPLLARKVTLLYSLSTLGSSSPKP